MRGALQPPSIINFQANMNASKSIFRFSLFIIRGKGVSVFWKYQFVQGASLYLGQLYLLVGMNE